MSLAPLPLPPIFSMLLMLVLVCVGCASGAARPDAPVAAQTLPDGIYDLRSGERIEQPELLAALEGAAFVVVGETHNDPWHHEVQAIIYDHLGSRDRVVALGLEMFQRPFQAPLDDYVAGRIDEATMLDRTEYATRWGFDTAFYSGMWRLAQARKHPIIALNAPKVWTRTTSKVGVENLPAEIKQALPTLDLTNVAHKDWMREVFKGHGMNMEPAKFDRFYQAQVIWDETMADSAASFAANNPGVAQVVVLAGSGHVLSRYGIPSRIQRRAPQATILTVIPETLSDPLTTARLDAWKTSNHADFVWVKTTQMPAGHP